MHKDFVIIIPVFNSDIALLDGYVNELRHLETGEIILVDDGSQEECHEGLVSLAEKHGCWLETHPQNLGKGAALKSAFELVQKLVANERIDPVRGVVTADSDGQHQPSDLIRVMKEARRSADSIIFGCRNFTQDNVPFRSRFGNTLTSAVFRLFYGLKLSDTQTGLRYIPFTALDLMRRVPGNRFEYETNMIIAMKRAKVPFSEITIETIYIDGNVTSNFRPIQDSIKIYRVIFSSFFKFVLSSSSAFIIDFTLFTLLIYFLQDSLPPSSAIFSATVISRAISSLYNYTVNRTLVFSSSTRITKSLVQYYVLVIAILIASACSVTVLWHALGQIRSTQPIIKIFVDAALFLVSYFIQRNWIFENRLA